MRKGKIRLGSYSSEAEGYHIISSDDLDELSPSCLKDGDRYLINIWNFSKVHQSVPRSSIKNIWTHPAEAHFHNGHLTNDYWNWRDKGMNYTHPIENPFSNKHTEGYIGTYHTPLFVIDTRNGKKSIYNEVEARKAFYLPSYLKTVVQSQKFNELKNSIKSGERLLLIDYHNPGPMNEVFYNEILGKNILTNGTVEVTKQNLDVLFNDPLHPISYTAYLAIALLDKQTEWRF
jgi:hypothetical protein